MRKIITILIAMIFVLVLLASYGCGGAADGTETPGTEEDALLSLPMIPDDLTGGKPWIDSCVSGNVTADTVTSPTEDFYAWVNKEWIISAEIPDGSPTMDFDPFAEGRTKVMEALAGNELSGHDAHQAQLLFRAFIDMDAREAAGCGPAREVIDDLHSISDIGELTAFLLDTERSAGVPTLIHVKNSQDYDEHRWVTRIELSASTFGSTLETMGMDAAAIEPESSVYRARFDLVHHILTRVGYTDEEAEKAFEGRLRLEKEIIRIAEETRSGQEKTLTLSIDQLDSLAGNFPLRAIVEARGYGQAEKFEVRSAAELRAADELYTDEHLDDLLDYFICGYALEVGGWLDSEAFDFWRADYDANGCHVSLTMPERNRSAEEMAVNLAAEITPTLVGRAYVEAYDLAHTKELIKSLCMDAVEAHKEIVSASTWLSETSKRQLTEKLDAITMYVVYPDAWAAIRAILSSMKSRTRSIRGISIWM